MKVNADIELSAEDAAEITVVDLVDSINYVNDILADLDYETPALKASNAKAVKRYKKIKKSMERVLEFYILELGVNYEN